MFPENDQYITDYMRSVGVPVTKASLTPEGRREFIERREVAIKAAWEEHNKGRILMEQGKYLEAEVFFKKAMEIDPFESSHRFSYNVCLR
jgi:tetratricopeptide (TPR) repeat protein